MIRVLQSTQPAENLEGNDSALELHKPEAPARPETAREVSVSDLSRQLRTPLTLLLGPLQDIIHNPASGVAPTARATLEDAARHALRLLAMVDSLPGLSPGDGEPVRCWNDLALFTEELAEQFRSACDWAGLKLVIDCPRLGEPVHMDCRAWQTIVVNLIANAFKSTFEGTITVRLRGVEDKAQLIVSDTGVGIAQGELPHLFAKRAGNSDRVFGLALVRRLVQRHKGSINVDSEPGRGSTFTVVLPAAAENEAGPALRTEVPPKVLSTRNTCRKAGPLGRVVVAEDDADTRSYLTELLHSAGYEVMPAADGHAALEACRTGAPDAVLTDLLMPGLDGFELIKRLRSHEPTAVIPVLLLSGHAEEDARIAGLAAGADDFLVKPLGRRELVARVDGAVRLARLRRETARRQQADLQALSQRLTHAQEAERKRIAFELHEQLGQEVSTLKILLQTLEERCRGTPEDARRQEALVIVSQMLNRVRNMALDLRPVQLDDFGLYAALGAHCTQQAQAAGWNLHLELPQDGERPDRDVELACFRVVQEGLTNIARYAKAAEVWVRLSISGAELQLHLRDNGVGFDVYEEGKRARSLGLVGMAERARQVGGRFQITSSPQGGTTIEAGFPMRASQP